MFSKLNPGKVRKKLFPGLKFPDLSYQEVQEPLPPGIWHTPEGVMWVGWQQKPFKVSSDHIMTWVNHILEGKVDINAIKKNLEEPSKNLNMDHELDLFVQYFANLPPGLKAFLEKEKTPFQTGNEVRHALLKFKNF